MMFPFLRAIADARAPIRARWIGLFLLVYGALWLLVHGGTVLVETLFSYPGIGLYAYKAASTLDYPAIMGTTLRTRLFPASGNTCRSRLEQVPPPHRRACSRSGGCLE